VHLLFRRSDEWGVAVRSGGATSCFAAVAQRRVGIGVHLRDCNSQLTVKHRDVVPPAPRQIEPASRSAGNGLVLAAVGIPVDPLVRPATGKWTLRYGLPWPGPRLDVSPPIAALAALDRSSL